MKLLNISDNIAKIFALAPKNLVLSMGKIFQFQIFTGFFKLHLFFALDALWPGSISAGGVEQKLSLSVPITKVLSIHSAEAESMSPTRPHWGNTPHGPKIIFGRAPSEHLVIKCFWALASGNSNAHLLPTNRGSSRSSINLGSSRGVILCFKIFWLLVNFY